MKKLFSAFLILTIIISYLLAENEGKYSAKREDNASLKENFSPLFKHISNLSSKGMENKVWNTSDKVNPETYVEIFQNDRQFMETQAYGCSGGGGCSTMEPCCTCPEIGCAPTYEDCTMDYGCTLAYGCMPPEPPYSPNPEDGATNVPVEGHLTWYFGWESYYYDLYLGVDGSPVQVVFYEPCSSGSQGIYQFSGLIPGTLYIWQVVVYNVEGEGNANLWSFTTQSGAITLNLKAHLEGPYNASSGNMNASLNPSLIPLIQPYNVPPWNYNGMESTPSIPNPDIVDWVLLEIRDATSADNAILTTAIWQQAAFLLRDGSIVSMDGVSLPQFSQSYSNNLFIIVWHRNHLGVMSAIPIIISDGQCIYDFSIGATQVYGGILGHKQINLNKWGMLGGDGDGNGQIDNSDKNEKWLIQSGINGYLSGDFNLNGTVDEQDLTIWYPNSARGTQIPLYNPDSCGSPFVDMRDEKVYRTVQIGDQCWMAENVNIGAMIQGNENQTNNSLIEKYCYDNLITNCDVYGGLYKWSEMMQYSTLAGTQGICPAGWHLPTDNDWCVLTKFIDQTVDCNINGWSGTDAGYKMKNTTGWNEAGNGSNSSGFSALPAGRGIFDALGYHAYFWSSTQYDADDAWARLIEYNFPDITRGWVTLEESFSVRCVKN